MLRFTNTTVFNVDAQTIVNTVNCVGVMGAGLALEFQLRFPEMEKDYVERCKAKKVEVGRPYLYKGYGNPWILNFPTKSHWKYPSKLEWIEQGLAYFARNYQRGGITSIAFPKLGCSNGGLEWNVVSPLMEKYLQDLNIDIFICEDTEREASGAEAFMVQMLNKIETHAWGLELGLRSDIRKKIVSALPIHRFRDLRKLEGIGKQTYNDIFSFLYTLASHSPEENLIRQCKVKNLSLFEENSSQGFELTNQTHQVVEVGSEEPHTLVKQNLNFKQNPDTEESDAQDKAIYLKKTLVNDKTESQGNTSEYDAFYIMLPYLEKALSIEQTRDEIASKFRLPKKLVSDWLEEAEKIGKIRRLSHRPPKYIAAVSISSEQLECSFGL